MTQEKEMIHELIFDFANGKTKNLIMQNQEDALGFMEKIHVYFNNKMDPQNRLRSFMYQFNGKNIFINLNNVCSITYNSYLKPQEENNE